MRIRAERARSQAGLLLLVLLAHTYVLRAVCKGPAELEARAQSSRNGGGYSDLGTWFGQHQQFDCANQAFRSSLRLNPNSAMVNYFLGVSLYSSGHKEEALASLSRSGELDPKAAQPHFLMATILDELHRRREAEEQWKDILKIHPDSSEALDGLSKAMIADHDYRAAIALLSPAKRDEAVTLDLASAYGQAGMLDEAAAIMEEALGTKPASMGLTKGLVTVYVHQRRYQDATALLRESLKKRPDDQEAQIQYLSVLVLTNDAATARPLGVKLLAAAPHNFDVLSLNGILEREAEQYANARDHLLEAVKLQPEDYDSRYNLGTTLRHLDQPAAAKEQLEKAIALSPSQPEAHFQLAGVLKTLNEDAAAQRQLAVYQKLQHDSASWAEADSKAKQARQRIAAGDTAQAVALYRQATQAAPGNALIQYELATTLDKTGDTANERLALEEAIKIDPTFALAANQLGFLAFRSGDTSKAEVDFRRAVEAAPQFAEAWINLAATLASRSDFTGARKAIANAVALEPKNAQALELSRRLSGTATR